MKKIITFFISLIAMTSLMSFSALATEYPAITDTYDLLHPDDEAYLISNRIQYIKDLYDYDIYFVSGEFASDEEFTSYYQNYTEYDTSGNGTILFYGIIGDLYSYASVPFGEYSEVLNDNIFARFTEIESDAETYYDSFETYIALVQIFLEENATTTTGTTSSSKYPFLDDYIGVGGLINGFDPLIDSAEVLSDEEEQALFLRIEEIHNEYDFDVTFMTLKETPSDGDLRYFFDWYEGVDPTRDGIIYGISFSPREFSNSARNFGEIAFNYTALNLVDSEVPPYFTNEEYFKAFNLYLDYTEEFLATAKAGTPYETPTSPLYYLAFVVLIPVGLAIIIGRGLVRMIFVSQMKTAVIKTVAKDFMKKDSLTLTVNSDVFSHKTTSRVYDPPPKKSSGGGGGGSSSSGYGGSRSGSSGSF